VREGLLQECFPCTFTPWTKIETGRPREPPVYRISILRVDPQPKRKSRRPPKPRIAGCAMARLLLMLDCGLEEGPVRKRRRAVDESMTQH